MWTRKETYIISLYMPLVKSMGGWVIDQKRQGAGSMIVLTMSAKFKREHNLLGGGITLIWFDPRT